LRFTQDVPDEQSIAAYYQSENYISHTNTNEGLVNKVYQSIRKYTLQKKASLIIQHTKPQGRLLDVGAGIGAFLDVIKQKGWNISGIEPDAGARSQAQSLFNIQLLQPSDLASLPRQHFDAITLWHVLEHVHQLHDYVAMLKSLLVKEGKLFIAVPNYQSKDAAIYSNHWAAYDVPRHLYHFTPLSVQHLLRQHGLRVIAQKPMWFDSFYISLLSNKYQKGKTNWINAGINGFRSNLAALFNNEKASSIIYIAEHA
jgi:2-polyprenyl-3-methyl-5-hydroxy-6-metoxy-1,4-benzoquinol methylase